MHETLDRIQEAQTALDHQMIQERRKATHWSPSDGLILLWIAKYHLWHAAWLVIDATSNANKEGGEPMPDEEVNP